VGELASSASGDRLIQGSDGPERAIFLDYGHSHNILKNYLH
jgi:hypothetical protein